MPAEIFKENASVFSTVTWSFFPQYCADIDEMTMLIEMKIMFRTKWTCVASEIADSALCDKKPSISVSEASTSCVNNACRAIGRPIFTTFR